MANATILVVDDDRETVKLVALCLQRDGYRVLLAYDVNKRSGWLADASRI